MRDRTPAKLECNYGGIRSQSDELVDTRVWVACGMLSGSADGFKLLFERQERKERLFRDRDKPLAQQLAQATVRRLQHAWVDLMTLVKKRVAPVRFADGSLSPLGQV